MDKVEHSLSPLDDINDAARQGVRGTAMGDYTVLRLLWPDGCRQDDLHHRPLQSARR
jgi:hypothetical protein